jgi:cytochrome P450
VTGANTIQDRFDFDPFSTTVMNNPHPFYKIMRREHPVYYSEKYDAFFISRFEDIVEMLAIGDNALMTLESSQPIPATLRTKNEGALPIPPDDPFPSAQSLGMPTLGEVRRAHIRPMMPRDVKQLAGFIRDLANARLDALLPQRRFNLTREYGGIVSSSVIMRLMGMPLELAGEALDIVNSGTRTDPETGGFDGAAVGRQAIELYLPYVGARMEAGANGDVPMVDGMINYRYRGRALSVEEAAQQLICAFIGGIETAPKIVAHGLMELAARPDQLAAVRADLETNIPLVAEEVIRYCAPAQWFMRTVQKPVTIGGQAINPGQRVFYLVGSALRDENEFDDPDAFHWNRDIRRTLAFGQGVHFCIGTHLARLEIRIMLDAFLRRVQEFSFDMEAAVRPPSSFQWGWNILPVVIERAD